MPARPARVIALPQRFTIVRQVGVGGMGIVFEAIDQERNLRVALKTLNELSPTSLYLLKQEFRSLAGILHPNLATLYELFQENEEYFLSMEFIDGTDFLSYVWGMGAASQGTTADESAEDTQTQPLFRAQETNSRRLQPVPGPGCDFQKLRSSLRQVAAGLAVLHGAGKLHRDIKPSNILVEDGGRAVLIDFGLVAGREGETFGLETRLETAGTPAYMSPEQSVGEALGPASDWYAVGIVLFQAITGRFPFEGRYAEVMNARQNQNGPAPRIFNPDTPEDLNALCELLIRRNPDDRPAHDEVLRVLGAGGRVVSDMPARAKETQFVGRRTELSQMRQAFTSLEQSRSSVILLHGTSGAGKTALSEHFLTSVSHAPDVVVLAGRCYEHEAMPYKAVDNLIDRLSRYLRNLPSESAAELLPRDALALSAVFRVLDRVEAFHRSKSRRAAASDPLELRRQAFRGLRELLARLGDRKRLILYIDDLQWSDPDSAALLAEVVRPPDAPVLLLLCAYRREYVETSSGLRRFLTTLDPAQRTESPRITTIALEPLPAMDSLELAKRQLVEAGAHTAVLAAAIVRESGGLPFFIIELAKWGALQPNVDLGELVNARVAKLDAEAGRILEVVTVAGRPIAQRDAFAVAELASRNPVVLKALTAAGLLRSAGPRGSDEVETFHDRIRETIAAALSPERKQAIHRRLADTLECGWNVDPEVLGFHREHCGDREEAGSHYMKAAAQATQALAFERAASLYQKVLDLAQLSTTERLDLQEALAATLINAGRGAEAGRVLLQAAKAATGSRQLTLEARGAYNLSSSGQVNEGLREWARVFAKIGIKPPAGGTKTLAIIAWYELLFRARRRWLKSRSAAEISPNVLARIDLLYLAAHSYGWNDPLRGSEALMRALILAMRAGERGRISYGMMQHLVVMAAQGVSRAARAYRELETAHRLIGEVGSPPELRAEIRITEMLLAYNGGRYEASVEHSHAAEKILLEECRGLNWEIACARSVRMWAFSSVGAYRRMREEGPRILEDAERRGDVYTMTNVGIVLMPYLHLAAGRPDLAKETVEQRLEHWPTGQYTLQHGAALQLRTAIALYEQQPEKAVDELEREWPLLEQSRLLLHCQFGLFLRQMRLMSYLSRAAAHRTRETSMTEKIKSAMNPIRRMDNPSKEFMLDAAQAMLLAMQGQKDAAIPKLENAMKHAEARGYHHVASYYRCRLGEWMGGERGRQFITEAGAWAKHEGVCELDKVARIWVVEI
jgi:eukaryotic-like serine/threonine-protein kinase